MRSRTSGGSDDEPFPLVGLSPGAKFIILLLLVTNNNLVVEIHLLQELFEHFGQGLGAQVIFTEEILKNVINYYSIMLGAP